jgi:hypothetical protein
MAEADFQEAAEMGSVDAHEEDAHEEGPVP